MEFASTATSMRDWLISIKMDEYIDLFELYMLTTVNQLWELNDDTLIEMGVEMRGHRKRLLSYRPKSEFKDRLPSVPILNDTNFLINFDDDVNEQLQAPGPPEIPPRIVPQIPPRPVTTPEPVPRADLNHRPVPLPGGRPVSSFPRLMTETSPLRERPVPQPRKTKPGVVTNGTQERNTHPIPAERKRPPQLPERPHSDEANLQSLNNISSVDLISRPVPQPPLIPIVSPPLLPNVPLSLPPVPPSLPVMPHSLPIVPPSLPFVPPSLPIVPPSLPIVPPRPDSVDNDIALQPSEGFIPQPTEPTHCNPYDLLNTDDEVYDKLNSEEYSIINFSSNTLAEQHTTGVGINGQSNLIDFGLPNRESEYGIIWPNHEDLPPLPNFNQPDLTGNGTYSSILDYGVEPPTLPPPPLPLSPPPMDDELSMSDSGEEEPNADLPTPKVVREGTLKRFQETLDGKSTTNEISGILSKQGGHQGKRGVQKRFVKFDGKCLRYFENEKKTCFSKKVIPVGAMRDVEVIQATSALKNNILELRTINRVYVFSHENMDVLISWSLVLMKAIVEHPKVEYLLGGEMNNPDKEGYMKVDETRLYVAAKSGSLCYYKNKGDFDAGTPITDICMNTSSCRELPKNKLQLHTPTRSFMFTLDSPEETTEWFNAIKETIDEALADKTVLNAIQQNIENKFCADCGMPEPDWSAVNFGVIICKKCSGAHRKLQFNVPKVRSVKMDINIWTPALQEIMIAVGNNINDFWEARLKNYKKPKPDDSIEVRKEFIERKYQYRMFCKTHPVIEFKGQEGLDKELCRIASNPDSLYEAMVLVYSGARFKDVHPEVGVSALNIAIRANVPSIMEIFNLNKDSDFSTQRPPPRINSVPVADSPSVPTPPRRDRRDTEEDRKSGYLFKTGMGRREFQKRYCRLENGTFSYSVDERSPFAKNTIEGVDILMIGDCQSRPGYEYCFEMGVTSGRTYLFCAETAEEKQEWMYILAKFLTPQVMWSYLDGFDLVGHLHKKEGITSTQWRRLTFLLRGKKLSYFSAEKDSMDDLDLRKLAKSYMIDVDQDEKQTSEQICICFPDKTLYLRSENKEHNDRWLTAIQNTLYESGTSLENQQLTKENIPVVVSECINFVEKNALKTEGVYRLAGVKSKASQILQNLYHNARDVRLTLDEDYLIHDVTSALKQYFRELDDPLLTSDLYNQWVKNSASQDHSRKVKKYAELVKELPEVNRSTLKELITHLRDVSDNKDENKMEVKNLAAVFGPTLMSGKNPAGGFGAANYEISVIGDLMLHYAEIFEITHEEVAKIEKKRRFMQRLSEQQLTNLPGNVQNAYVHVTLYIGPKSENEPIDVQMSESMTAGELIQSLIDTNKINMPASQVSVFEIICNGELERVFNPQEKVLPEMYRWDEKMRTENYICIKKNDLERKIEKYLTLLTANSHVTFFGKKKIKKAFLEVTGVDLKCYKDKKKLDKPVYSSRVSDIVFYFGVEKKKSPKFGFTFIDRKDDPIILRAVLVETEEDVYYWLGCLLNTKKQCAESSNNNLRTPPMPTSRSRSPFKELLGSRFLHFSSELKDRANKFAGRRLSRLRYTYRQSQLTRNSPSTRPDISSPTQSRRPIPATIPELDDR